MNVAAYRRHLQRDVITMRCENWEKEGKRDCPLRDLRAMHLRAWRTIGPGPKIVSQLICDARRWTGRPTEWLLPRLPALKCLLCQDIESHLVRPAVEVLEQGIFEERVVGSRAHKQGHAGAEFQIVGIAEDFVSAATLHVQDKLGTFSKSGT